MMPPSFYGKQGHRPPDHKQDDPAIYCPHSDCRRRLTRLKKENRNGKTVFLCPFCGREIKAKK